MAKACITYSVITDESAKNGDYAEHGWYLPGGWEHPLEDNAGCHDEVLAEAQAGEYDLPLRAAIQTALDLDCRHEIEICGRSLSAQSIDPPCDRAFIEDGEHRSYTLHLEASPGTLKRIARLLNAKL